ncbi:ArsR/SmtB family transcription factor [Gottfriedia solisilvae]|uniref:ArsR/SmtB family transcription factor n=1 Tax=Gottfriedia solisilvae TaxID=1516104 RepID=UPI003D2EB291
MESTNNNDFEDVLIALADPTRRQLLNLIATMGQATATTLAKRVTVSRQAVVKHLTVLNGAELVASNRVGREVKYSVSPEKLAATAEWMARLATDWDRRLEWIKLAAESKNKTDLN